MSSPSANSPSAASPHPYIPNTGADRAEMLDAIGVSGFDELIADIPAAHVYPDLDFPEGAPEPALTAELSRMAATNATPGDYACFLGAGAYRHFVPAVTRSIASRGEFVTAYTPYQPEAAQGTLQVGFEFQTAVCQLTGMEVANAGMYDGATAFAEAALMACRVTRRNSVAVLETVDERLVEVLDAYSRYQGVEINIVDSSSSLPDGSACLMAQSPNVYGVMEDLGSLVEAAHAWRRAGGGTHQSDFSGNVQAAGRIRRRHNDGRGTAAWCAAQLRRSVRRPAGVQAGARTADAGPHRGPHDRHAWTGAGLR